MPGEIPLTTKDNIFARAGEYQAARPMNPGVKFAREVDVLKNFMISIEAFSSVLTQVYSVLF
jgi:hypothetical protein